MDGETPSWLEEGGDSSTPGAAEPSPPHAENPAPPAFSLDETSPASNKTEKADPARAETTDNVAGSILPNAADSNAKVAASNAEDEKDLPKIILMMRVLNMAAAALLITCSVFNLIPSGTPLSVWIMAIYASCGGILVCCLETQLKFVRTIIAMNFGFLFNSVYRAIFYCLMASVTWSYKTVFGFITAITLGCAAVFNTFVLCRYPAYRKMREKIAAEEDRRIQAKINQQVTRQAVNQMGWGKN